MIYEVSISGVLYFAPSQVLMACRLLLYVAAFEGANIGPFLVVVSKVCARRGSKGFRV